MIGLGNKRDIKIQIIRKGEKKTVNVKLIPEDAVFNSGLIRQKMGAILKPLTPELADALNHNSTDGFVISQIDNDSPAKEAGLQPGLIITSINGEKFNDMIDIARFVNSKKTGEEIVLEIIQLRRRGLFVRRSTGKLTLTLL